MTQKTHNLFRAGARTIGTLVILLGASLLWAAEEREVTVGPGSKLTVTFRAE